MNYRSIFESLGLFLISTSLTISCTSSPNTTPTTESIPASNASPASTVTPTSESKVMKLGFNNWPGFMPWQVSDEAKLFKSDKWKFTPIWHEDYLRGIGALVAGQLDANSQTLMDTVLSVAEGSDQVVVLVNDSSTGNDKIIVKSGINSPNDLKGKTVAVEKGTVVHYLLLLALKKANLTEKDVTMKFMDTQKASESFAAGEVDAVASFTPASSTALKRAGSKELVSSKDFPGAISDVLSFRRDFVEKHPEVVQATVDNWFDSLKYIKANSAKANEIMAKKSKVTVSEYTDFGKGIKIFDAADNSNAFKAGKDRNSLSFSAAELKKTVIDLGLTKKDADVSKLFDDRFVKAYLAKSK